MHRLIALPLLALVAGSALAQSTLPLSQGALERDELYASPSGDHFLIFQTDGDLVVVDTDGRATWRLSDAGVPVDRVGRVVMQADGNLAVYAADGGYLWSALHERPDPSARLTVSAEGTPQLVTEAGVVWPAPPSHPAGPAQGTPPTTTSRPDQTGHTSDACAATPDSAGGRLDPGLVPSFVTRVGCLERLAHRAANRARQDAGLDPLRWSDAYAAVARAHSDDMVRQGYVSHTSLDGTPFSQRMEAAGLGCVGLRAENIAVSYAVGAEALNANGEVVAVEWLARDALGRAPVAQWLDSPPHRRNLLNPAHTQHAIAFAWDAQNRRVLATQLLCE